MTEATWEEMIYFGSWSQGLLYHMGIIAVETGGRNLAFMTMEQREMNAMFG